MDALAVPERSINVLLELRAALDKHAGIPQQTRLLFQGLSLLDEVTVEGLIQSGTHALGKGLLTSRSGACPLPRHREIDRLGRIVIMLEQKYLRSRVSAIPMVVRRFFGFAEELSRFDPQPFRDFVWRRLFARSLPPADFEAVTSAGFRVARTPWTAMHIGGLISQPVRLAMFPCLNTTDFDVMIAETPYPATVSPRTQLVVRYHDAIPLLMPHTISDRRHHQGFHYRALRRNVESGAWFACVSEATRKDLLSIFPQVESRSMTIHNLVSHHYFDESSSPDRVREIIAARLNARVHRDFRASSATLESDLRSKRLQYLLIVSTVEPRKNHLTLLTAWERLRHGSHPDLKLVVVGSLGWRHKPILAKFRPWVERGDTFFLEDVPSSELRLLYKHAGAVVCPSLAEGFDLSGVEAMASGGIVAASDIAVHREIYLDAAQYFNPYSVDTLFDVLQGVLEKFDSGWRLQLVARGAAVSGRYRRDEILPKWRELLLAARAAKQHDSGIRSIPQLALRA